MFTKTNTEKKANKLSDFWMIDKFDTSKYESLLGDRSTEGYMRLATLRRSISNFVTIVTNEKIPVEFIPEHYDIAGVTDGKTVYISAQIEKGDLDSVVGLALHEASHILLTDFRMIAPETLLKSIPTDLKDVSEKKGATPKIMTHILKNLLNWVEDRRIDYYLYKEDPGYQGYYDALYDRYFHSDIVTKALQSSECRTEDIDSYLYRIINILNSGTDLSALKGLKEINDIIDIKKIDRLKNTSQALYVAIQIAEIIFKYIDDIDTEEMEKQIDGPGDGEQSGDNDGDVDDSGDGDSDGDGDADADDAKDSNSKGSGKKKKRKVKPGKSSKASKIKLEDLTPEEMKELRKEIEKQKDFLNGNIEKVKLSGDDLEKIEQLANSGTEIKNIKLAPQNENQIRIYDSVFNVREYNVVVIKKVTYEMAKSQVFSFLNSPTFGDSKIFNMNQKAVTEGIVLGKRLGSKLQIRNEERLTKYTRKETGKIDKRLISELGFGNVGVFQQTTVESYADAILHISIDVSGSMKGRKLANAIKVVTAICQAASMTVGNLNVVVSIRSTEGIASDPFIAIIYDSRVDNMSKVRRLFPLLQTSGTTPEGLCFAAIQDLIDSSTTKLYSYFLNLSDGEPFFTGYSGKLAAEHTRGEVNKMRSRGVNVLSYFIGNNAYHHEEFDTMYGKSASYIDPNSLMEIANTLNKLFLAKD